MDLRRFYEEQLELIRDGDVAALVEQHYHPDAERSPNTPGRFCLS